MLLKEFVERMTAERDTIAKEEHAYSDPHVALILQVVAHHVKQDLLFRPLLSLVKGVLRSVKVIEHSIGHVTLPTSVEIKVLATHGQVRKTQH